MTRKCLLATLAVTIVFAAAAKAAPIDLVKYQFPSTTNNETGIAYAAVAAAGLAATNIGDTSGKVTMTVENLSYPAGTAPVMVVGPGATAFDPTVYFGFTVTPADKMDLSSLTIDAAKGGGSARGFVVRSSADNFATNLVVSGDSTAIPTVRPILTSYTVDLSGAAFDAVASPLEFRIYVFSGGPTLTIDFDNIVLHGQTVPEPASLGLLVIGGMCALGRRMRAGTAR